MQKHCQECGTKLIAKELENEGQIPFCSHCEQFRFPSFNTAVSLIVVNQSNHKVLLIQQYGRPRKILVAGYVSKGESLEETALRELKEETCLTGLSISFNKSQFFEPSNTLMCNFTVFVKDDGGFQANHEIDAYDWYSPEEARQNNFPHSLAASFLNYYLDRKNW
ncbi:NUDIX hydrolase [Streptococcus pseudoporcinus]|uniref:NAD(+) diphosphatase n=1 Tax=Streptococcus pseudoporcinus TaxID=361101 RepID=A0A4U9ZQT0_9STRE|nr:NUDIX domain-containing protein [Streptococcus pseudoporcinus]VTS43270.1 NUDIX hydrolase [Streptococcus pseudoporcinus]